MSVQGVKERSRLALHRAMSRPASFYLDPSVEPPSAITARPHSRSGQVGDLAGTNLNYAEVHDREESVVFWRSEIVPLTGEPGVPPRGSLVIFSATEGYWIDNVQPPDGQTVTAEVTRASTDELSGKTLPGA